MDGWDSKKCFQMGVRHLRDMTGVVSDRLHEVFSPWAKDIVLAAREYDDLFEAFELLAGLAYLSVNIPHEELKAALDAPPGMQSEFVWMPGGRSVWHGEVRERVIESLQSKQTKGALLAAGFFQGNADWFDRGIENARRMMGRLNW
jgi:hypothetical protein